MRLTWAEQAEADIDRIADDYFIGSPGLDDLMIERIEAAPLPLLQHPRLGPSIEGLGLRKWSVRRTPFVLLYRVLDDAVEIARVVHGMSDWRSPLS